MEEAAFTSGKYNLARWKADHFAWTGFSILFICNLFPPSYVNLLFAFRAELST